MASHCYLVGPAGEIFVEYLVRHCAMPYLEKADTESPKEFIRLTGSYYPFLYKKPEVWYFLWIFMIFSDCIIGADWKLKYFFVKHTHTHTCISLHVHECKHFFYSLGWRIVIEWWDLFLWAFNHWFNICEAAIEISYLIIVMLCSSVVNFKFFWSNNFNDANNFGYARSNNELFQYSTV